MHYTSLSHRQTDRQVDRQIDQTYMHVTADTELMSDTSSTTLCQVHALNIVTMKVTDQKSIDLDMTCVFRHIYTHVHIYI